MKLQLVPTHSSYPHIHTRYAMYHFCMDMTGARLNDRLRPRLRRGRGREIGDGHDLEAVTKADTEGARPHRAEPADQKRFRMDIGDRMIVEDILDIELR